MWLLEEEEDESTVAANSWEGIQGLAGEAQVQVLTTGDQAPSTWPALYGSREPCAILIHARIPPGMGWAPFSPGRDPSIWESACSCALGKSSS